MPKIILELILEQIQIGFIIGKMEKSVEFQQMQFMISNLEFMDTSGPE